MMMMMAFQNIGGGWIEAQNSRGEIGLVPEDYIEVSKGNGVFKDTIHSEHETVSASV